MDRQRLLSQRRRLHLQSGRRRPALADCHCPARRSRACTRAGRSPLKSYRMALNGRAGSSGPSAPWPRPSPANTAAATFSSNSGRSHEMPPKNNQAPTSPRVVRCACYTRKSTEEGLEQEFNSLDAQRESAEAYIKSQLHEGWQCLPDRYDDGGFTGANMERPALKRLLTDIEAGLVDCVLVNKVDRLSRSLLDFARLMEMFDKHQIAFVSVTQQFNSASSMGRLVLNVLLSFAQFEREIISER